VASLDGRKVENALKKKGFKENADGKHKQFRFFVDGIDVGIHTMTSHNQQDITDGLIGKMSGQLKMEKQFFKDFIDCSKSEADYVSYLKAQNHLL
jgi:predicted RNA binding protein YcfA (HicA-like mRNA interferase family)